MSEIWGSAHFYLIGSLNLDLILAIFGNFITIDGFRNSQAHHYHKTINYQVTLIVRAIKIFYSYRGNTRICTKL